MPDDYTPIKTNAERQAESVAKAAGWLKDKAVEAVYDQKSVLRQKFDQGRDELVNALYTGSGYMPWPDQQQTQQEAGSVFGPPEQQQPVPTRPNDEIGHGVEAYMSGNYTQRHDHSAAYVTPSASPQPPTVTPSASPQAPSAPNNDLSHGISDYMAGSYTPQHGPQDHSAMYVSTDNAHLRGSGKSKEGRSR